MKSKTVDPITNLKDIKSIKKLLAGNQRDLTIFTLGINTNLRASDILGIKVGQVKDKEELVLTEKKTGKSRRITMNNAVQKEITALLDTKTHDDDDFLFTGQRGALRVPTLSKMVKGWCKEINLKGNYASHSMRKTFGYHQRVTFGTSLPELMVIFNHSTQKQTLDYLCVQDEEIKNIYKNEI